MPCRKRTVWNWKKRLVICLLIVSIWISGCSSEIGQSSVQETAFNTQNVISEEDTAQLQISVIHADDAYADTDLPKNPDQNSYIGFSCIGLSDVTIVVDGDHVDLEKAIRSGKISLGEIIAHVQADALAGFCEESWKSENGLAKFCYSYPDFDLWITNDIYETPDGQQHLIRQITLTQPGSDVLSVYPELDQEDWGITFTVIEATPGSITLDYTQSGGQLIGQLVTGNYEISRLNPMEAVFPLSNAPVQERFQLIRNTHGSFTLDLETYFGLLPAGEYGMYLYLHDEYNEEDVPPLVRNYHDMQCYWVTFSVS